MNKRMSVGRWLGFFPLCALSLWGLGGCDLPGTSTGVLMHDGIARTYRLHLPPYDVREEAMPLLVILHGGYTADIMADSSQFDLVSDREGFVAVYPNGVLGWWDVGEHVFDLDDVDFIATLIDHLAELYPIDTGRVFATGSSNGGFMVHKLALEIPDKLRGFATAMSSLTEELAERGASAKPIPFMHVQGTEDPIVPMGGGRYFLPFDVTHKAVPILTMIDFWVAANGAYEEPVVTYLPELDPNDGMRIVKNYYEAGPAGAPVILYLVEGGGHAWPGSPWPDNVLPGSSPIATEILGKTSMDMNASDVVWEFFESLGPEPPD